jgi:hypothetical protein
MSRAADARLGWTIVSIAIGGLTETQIARRLGVPEQSLHRATAKFAKIANLDPAGGLRPLGQIRSNGAGSHGSFEAAVEAGKITGFRNGGMRAHDG